jgi:methylmalonyl-CoA mutase N-terminal domain/subunit
MGGMVQAIENGFVQKEIQDSAYRYQREVESNERVIVGVNKFVIKEEKAPDLLKVDPALRRVQIEKIQAVKAQRNNQVVQEKLTELRNAARNSGQNLMPPIIAAVREYATLGEICGILRQEFGEYQESIVL